MALVLLTQRMAEHMNTCSFNEKEYEVVGHIMRRQKPQPVFNFPITMREQALRTYRDHDPWWVMTNVELNTFTPSVIPDHGARGFVFEAEPYPREKFGGKDMFGVEWEYIDVAGGSMVKPGAPLFTDANEWKNKVVFPDIDSWDWNGSEELNRGYCQNGHSNVLTLLNGCWFERLVSFMDFENAAMALIDEEQQDAVKELIHETTSLYLRIVDKCVTHFDVDGISIHDDWGSQQAPFFSEEVARRIFLPEMKRFVNHVHSKGLFCDLHSCGHIEERCGVFVDAGFDSWLPMPMNDTQRLYREYGDKILLGVVYEHPFDPETTSEEDQRAAARDFVEKYTLPGKPAMFSSAYNPMEMLTKAFREELYRASRYRYGK